MKGVNKVYGKNIAEYKSGRDRYILFIISLFIAALGVAITKKGELGVWLIIWNCALILGQIVLGFGISLSVIANVIMNSGEAFVKAISDTIHKDFGNVKICFDVSCVVVALVLSMLFFHKIQGTCEGTIIAALCTGLVVKLFTRLAGTAIERVLVK